MAWDQFKYCQLLYSERTVQRVAVSTYCSPPYSRRAFSTTAHYVDCLIQDGLLVERPEQHSDNTTIGSFSQKKFIRMISVDGSNKPGTLNIKSRRRPIQDLSQAVHVWKGRVNVTKNQFYFLCRRLHHRCWKLTCISIFIY